MFFVWVLNADHPKFLNIVALDGNLTNIFFPQNFQVIEEMSIQTNVPAIAMEEVFSVVFLNP